MVKNGRAVLAADVVALTVERGRVVDYEEDFQQVAVTEQFRIEGDTHHFRVSGVATAHCFIGRIGALTTHVSGLHAFHTAQPVVHRFQAPETTSRQRRNFLAFLSLFHDRPPPLPYSPRSQCSGIANGRGQSLALAFRPSCRTRDRAGGLISVNDVLIGHDQFSGQRIGVPLVHENAPFLSQPRAQVTVAHQPDDVLGEIRFVVLRHQRAALRPDNVARAHDGGGHDRQTQRHRLQQHQPLGLGA